MIIDPKILQEAIDTFTSELETIDAVLLFLRKARATSTTGSIDKELCAAFQLLQITRMRIAMEVDELEYQIEESSQSPYN